MLSKFEPDDLDKVLFERGPLAEARNEGYEACYAQSKVIINDLLADLSEAQLSLQSVKNARLWVEQD
jgi:hypothetical protein